VGAGIVRDALAFREEYCASLRKLRLINRAQALGDLRAPPGNRLEALKGERWGQYSIRVNDQWRICFNWREGGAADVQIVDYH
jgi:proteic killer suppression protein